MRATEHAPRDPFHVFERRYGLAEIVQSCAVGFVGDLLVVQTNLANTYQMLGRLEDALPLRQDVYSVRLRLYGVDNEMTLVAANNYAHCLMALQRYAEAKPLIRKAMPAVRRVLGESHELSLKTRWFYARALYDGAAACRQLFV